MKKINLNQLSMSWNEKQMPQKFRRYAGMLIMLLTLGVGQMWASTTATMYFSIPASTVGCYTVKAYYNFGYSQSGTVNMTKVGYNGTDVVYSVELTANHDNVDDLKFQWWDGETWKGEKQVLSGWVALDKDGQMYSYSSSSWGSYSIDAATSYKIYFVNNDSWGSCYAYAYYADCQNNWSWHGQSMSSESKQYGTKNIYSITLTSRFPNVIFNDNSSSEKASTACYDNRGKMYDNGTWRTLQYKVTLNMQSGTGGSGSVTAVCGSAMPSATMPTRVGYTFAGYYTSTGGSGTKYYNADGTSANDWPANGTGPTTLYAHWTQDPGVATLTAAGNATELWIGVNASAALTFTATSSNVSSGTAVTWSLTDNTGDCTVSTTTSSHSGATFSYTPGSTGAKTITVTMTIGGNNYTKTYNLTVYERWNIYVRDDVDNWGTMKLYLYDNSTSTSKSAWPGDACSSYKSSAKWYTVTLDSKWPHFILNNNNAGKQLLGNGSIATDKATYTPGSYWKTVWNSDGIGGDAGKKFYTLKSATITDPVVAITRCDVYSTYALLEGNVTGFGGDGSALSDLMEYGFYIGETKNTTIRSTSGNYFRVKVTGLTPGNTYNIKAFATNIDNTANSAVQSKTASNASRTIGVRYPDATAQTLNLYAYRDIPADYETETVKNANWSGVTLTRRAGTSRWWETTVTNAADYEYFIVSNNGSNEAAAQAMPATDKCYWYNPDGSAPKIGIMDCPYTTPQLYINATADATDYAYNEMSTSPSISKTMSLSAGTYTFKIMYNAEWYGKNSDNTISRTGATTSNAVSGLTIDQGYITLTADFAGDYIFTFNPSTNTVSVTYPEAHTVNYSALTNVGTGSGNSGDPSAVTSESVAVTSGDYVLDGTSVTFTASTAKTGYTWRGWFNKNNPSTWTDGKVSTDDNLTYTTTVSDASVTVYAIYTEDLYTVTVTADEHGTITTPAAPATTVTAGVATKPTITAEAVYGYYFKNWTVEEGSAEFTNASAISTTVSASSNATIKANFVSHWTIAGGDTDAADGEDAMGDWSTLANSIEHFEEIETDVWQGYVDIELPANTTFYFKVRDLYDGSAWYGNTGEMTYGNHTDWLMTTGSSNCRITTAGKGSYKFTWNETTKHLTVTYPTSYTVTYNVSTFYNEDASHDYDNTRGGSITYAKDNDSITLTSGKYVVSGGKMVFKATPAAGYRLAGWYSDQACETAYTDGVGGAVIAGDSLVLTISGGNKTVYAKFAEKMTTVTLAHNTHGHVENGSGTTITSIKAGVYTHPSITAVPDAGYYFSSWEVTEGSDFTPSATGESNTTITITGGGAGSTSGQVLTANFVELDKIYFRNIFDDGEGNVSRWSDVYVYYDITWDAKKVHTNSNSSYIAHMSQITGKDVYWAYVPRAFTVSNHKNVAFSDTEFTANYDFYNVTASGSKAAARGDYNKALNMFVPNHTAKETNINGVDYFDNGYWMKYDTRASQGAGYYLKKFKSQNNYWQMGEFVATADDATAIRITIRVDNTGTDSTRFMIVSAGALNYLAESTITATDFTKNVYENLTDISKESIYFQMTTDTEGDFTFILDQSGDVMKLTVDYPVSPGDYRLKHTYTGRNKANSADSTYITYSDVIKSNVAGSGKTLSMYLNNGGSETLVLQKCTEISTVTKDPVWSEGYNDNLNGILTKVGTDGNSVYQFDITVNTTSDKVSAATNIKKYDGPFYIKTDYAPGGWVNYTQNVMDENTINYDKTKPETFDYYFCKWIDEGKKNVKCVIANEYSQQITDTLIGDDILGIDASTSKPREYLAYAANVRFSYNSYTNELKRAYINGATDWQKSFLCLSAGSAVITDTDGNAFDGNSTTFVDQNNWIYMVDINAYEQARVKLTANYRFNGNDHIQYLIGKDGSGSYDAAYTQEILGGSRPEDWHTIRVIYDFKTNKLISAWLADGSEVSGTRAIETDVLVVRTGQGDPTQITFANASSQLTEVDTVYSALCLTKDYLNNSSLSDSERRYYWVSFPYDVRISDIFGSFGEYGEYWIFQRYNGKKRAQYGFWAESSSNWEYITNKDTVLKAFEGYVLTLDLDEFNSSNMKFWGNDVTQIYEYFPSMSKQNSIEYALTKPITINQEGYQCTIDRSHEVHNGRELGPEYDRRVRDSYWHLIGVPSYAQTTNSSDFNNAESGWTAENMPFFYSWNMSTNKLSAASTTTSDPFMPMRAYLVQYSGTTITWNAVSASPSSIVARRQAAEDIQFAEFNLHLMSGEESLDHTYVRLTDNEDASEDFEFGHDLCKEFQNGANIYTIIDQLEVAGNSLPLNTTGTTIVPVGVKIVANGEYIFSMPDGTNGIGVVLVDKVLNTRTNLGLTDYTVNLTSGKIDNRFWLEISPVQDAPTGIETVSGDGLEMRGARKVMIDGLLYIVKDGKIFDAQGRNIQ